jgi:hypothetical protein
VPLLAIAVALSSLAAVLFDSRPLGILGVALGLMLVALTSWALVRRAARPIVGPFHGIAASLGRRLTRAEAWIGDRSLRAGRRIAHALGALDARFGGHGAAAIGRVPHRVVGALRLVLRALLWLGVVLVSLLVLGGLIYLVSGVLGSALAGRTTPIDVEWLYLGAILTAAVLVLVLAIWIREFGLIVRRAHWRKRTAIVPALFLVALGTAALSVREVPGESAVTDAGRLDGRRGTDILLVVDPADPAGRELTDYLRADPSVPADHRTDTLAPDVGFGLVEPVDPALPSGSEPWTVLWPPTANRRHFRDLAASVAPRDGARATRGYPALLERLRDPGFVDWHAGALRTVALVLAQLPVEATLNRGGDAPAWAQIVSAYHRDRGREDYVRPVVFTQERRPDRLALWREWLKTMGGRLVTYGAAGPTLVADIEDAATGAPVSGVRDLARIYSPHLRFDKAEQFFPVNVDDLLSKGGDHGGHHVCDHVWFTDDCRSLDDFTDLFGDLDEYIDFEGGARLGQDLVDRDAALGVRPQIYVDAIERDHVLQLAYWWYLRYNVSPWQSARNCLPGLTFAETTCFDHEGDWEGVTVTLNATRETDAPDPSTFERWKMTSVSYASHKYLTQWASSQLRLFDRTHPVVFVAKGSHASYPTRCLADCTQKLAASRLPEGDFGGQTDWAYNDTACCLPLPVSPDHHGTRWNAFRGKWGKAVCTAIGKVCTQSDGPDSPSRQTRFRAPVGATFAGQAAVLARHKARYGEP